MTLQASTHAPFDRRLLRVRRDRAAPRFSAHDFLVREAAGRMAERLLDIKRGFRLGLDLGCHTGQFAAAALATGRVEAMLACDLSPAMARMAPCPAAAADEEALPFRAGGFDLIASCLSLQWVNDLPGALAQIRRCLSPDGLFLASVIGGESLARLRDCLTRVEIMVSGGASPRVAPMLDIRDAGALLQRAGFALPVADWERLEVRWSDLYSLMRDLRGMGEGNVLADRLRRPTSRRLFEEAARLYGEAEVQFDILHLAGWAPHESQQKPLKPGSAEASLITILEPRQRK
jgi:SAM-dependent methyltransferase